MGTQEARGQVQALGSRGYQADTIWTPPPSPDEKQWLQPV